MLERAPRITTGRLSCVGACLCYLYHIVVLRGWCDDLYRRHGWVDILCRSVYQSVYYRPMIHSTISVNAVQLCNVFTTIFEIMIDHLLLLYNNTFTTVYLYYCMHCLFSDLTFLHPPMSSILCTVIDAMVQLGTMQPVDYTDIMQAFTR